MDTHFLINSDAFSPTAGELDDEHDDYINPGLYALELADFLENALKQHGYQIKYRCQEDWGHWAEIEHDGRYTLALCCANTGEEIEGRAEHRVFIDPKKPVIRRWFRKIDISSDLEKLSAALRSIFDASPEIHSFEVWAGD